MADRAAAWVQFDDVETLHETLKTAGKRAEGSLLDMLQEVGEMMATRMRELVPVRTGRLRSDIRVIRLGAQVIVGPTIVPYAAHVEFGTGGRGELTGGAFIISSRRGIIALEPKKTAPIKGQRAQPYVRPAAAEFVKQLGPRAATVGLEMVVGRSTSVPV